MRRPVTVHVNLRAVGRERGVVGGERRRGRRLGEAGPETAGSPRHDPGDAAARRRGGLDPMQELGLGQARRRGVPQHGGGAVEAAPPRVEAVVEPAGHALHLRDGAVQVERRHGLAVLSSLIAAPARRPAGG